MRENAGEDEVRRTANNRSLSRSRSRVWFNINENKREYEMDVKKFVEAARMGEVTVSFEKINDGGLRVMPCTLNRALSGDRVPEVYEINEESDNIAVWCIDKEAWRSFRIDTVVDWEITV
tara:strand:- start:2026 stop:2385 length:360 start_codon:yes stop_codon:yes gene_type:complete